MTREEKIDWLCRLRSDLDVWMPEMNKYRKMYKQVLSEAIEALSEPTVTKADGYSLTEVAEALKRHGLMEVDDSEPTRPKAKWIDHIDSFSSWVECSECGSERAYHTKFCPDCGAEMESE